MRELVSALVHHLCPLVEHKVGVPSCNGCLLCEAETAIPTTSCVGSCDADWLPGDVGLDTLVPLPPHVVGQCGAVLLVDVKEGGLVVVEPPLEGDGSLSKVLFIGIATLSLYICIL